MHELEGLFCNSVNSGLLANSQDQKKTYRAELELHAETGHGRWGFLTMGQAQFSGEEDG